MPERWQGQRDDISQRSDKGLLVSINTSYRVGGELRRRPGLTERINTGGQLVQEFRQGGVGTLGVFFSTSGILRAIDLATPTVSATNLKTGMDFAYRGCFGKSNGRLYFVNDFEKMQVIERGDSACSDAGMAAPTNDFQASTSVASGNGTTGTHRLRYRYKNTKSGYVSNPSGELSLAVVSSVNGSNTFPVGTTSTSLTRSTDVKCDQLVIEMTAVNGQDFFQATTVANSGVTSVTVNIADASLVQQTNITAFFGDFGHEQPPLASIVAEHRGRLFLLGATERTATGLTVTQSSTLVTGGTFSPNWTGRQLEVDGDTRSYTISAASSSQLVLSENYAGSTSAAAAITVFSNAPDTLYWSRAGFPESWKPLEQARRVLQNEADTPAGMISQNDVLYLFGQRSQRKLIYTNDPATGKMVHVPTDMGVWNQQCLVEADGLIYGFGRSGVFVTDGSGPRHISEAIDDTVFFGSDFSDLAALDVDSFATFHGVFNPRERCISWWYTTSEVSTPKQALTYDIDAGTWRIDTYRQAIDASCQTFSGTSRVRPLVSQKSEAESWYLDQDLFDGVPAAMTNGGQYTGVVTCAAGCTNNVLQIASPSLPTANGGLKGVMVTKSTGVTEQRIFSNTSSVITMGTNLSFTPSAGTELFLGSIPWEFRTKWWVDDSLIMKKDIPYLCIQFIPGATGGKIIVSIFADFSATASAFSSEVADTFPDGVTWTSGATFATIDLAGGNGKGLVCFRPPVRWARSYSAKLSSFKPLGDLAILDVSWSTTDPRQTVREYKD